MAHNPVGDNVVLAVTNSSGQSASLPQQSDTVRVVNTGASGVHVAIGSTPVATTANYFIASNDKAVISLGQPSAQQVVYVEKTTGGALTTCTLPQGVIGAPFEVGDTVALTSNKSGWNFQHHEITAITFPSFSDSTGDLAQCVTVTVSFDSSGYSGTWVNSDSGGGDYGTLRKTFQVAGIATVASHPGTLNIQQVQVSGDA